MRNFFFHGVFFKVTLSVLRCTWTGRINLKIFLGMKNVVKCYKDFFGYFNALKTHGDEGQELQKKMKCANFYLTFVQDFFKHTFFLKQIMLHFIITKGHICIVYVVEIYSCIILAFHYLYMPLFALMKLCF